MLLLSNTSENNHQAFILQKLQECNESFIAVAFLKVSGLNLLLPSIKRFLHKGGRMKVLVGQNFGLTEPEALHVLLQLFQQYDGAELFLAKANSDSSVFHPKLYLFNSGSECCIISGSANITEGGLTSNTEVSLCVTCGQDDSIWQEATSCFDTMVSDKNADEATLLVIKQYETFYEQQKKHNNDAKVNPERKPEQVAFDYVSLAHHFKEFEKEDRLANIDAKASDYANAKKILDAIADNPYLTQKQFEPLLDQLVGSKDVNRFWHSGSLFRLRRKVYPYFKEFRDLVIFIRANKAKSADIVFKGAKALVEKIDGAAVNYVCEIMMTYNPIDFANLNRNPITVLTEKGGVNLRSHSSSFDEHDYAEYCLLVMEISNKLGLRNMLEADSFFNYIYWKI